MDQEKKKDEMRKFLRLGEQTVAAIFDFLAEIRDSVLTIAQALDAPPEEQAEGKNKIEELLEQLVGEIAAVRKQNDAIIQILLKVAE